MNAIDITGQRFGKLIAIERMPNIVLPSGKLHTQWLCQCDCGNQTTVLTKYLRNGHATSCGCKKRKKSEYQGTVSEDSPKRRKCGTNICFDCQRACGDCSWSEIDQKTRKPRFEPVPGWTAEVVHYPAWMNGNKAKYEETYHITACPLYISDRRRCLV